MKKNDWIFALAVAAYSYLFYHQGTGVNFLIFSALMVACVWSKNKNNTRSIPYLVAASGTLLSAFCVCYYGNGLSIIANIFSLLLLSALCFNPATSVIIALFFSVYSICASFIFMILDMVERAQKKVVEKAESSLFIRVLIIALCLIVVIVFFLLYKGSNPIFDEFTKNIKLDFNFFEWFFFTMAGSFLVYGFLFHRTIKAIEVEDNKIPNRLTSGMINSEGWFAQKLGIRNEIFSGVVLLLLLNLLLLVVNALDVNYLWFDGSLPKGMNYSDFVHQETGLLILSIIIAILIIMFYFRGAVNFYSGNKLIRVLAFIWIIQNAFMIVSTSYRNQLYIHEYSLTYKRIGVYVWLALALFGLITTLVKIMKTKTNWFLFRANSWLYYGLLIISSLVNWDNIITDYNVKQAIAQKRPLDKFYLLSLSDSNLPQLLTLDDSLKTKNVVEEDWSSASGAREYINYNRNFKSELSRKLYNFMVKMNRKDWQSYTVEDSRVYKLILDLNEKHLIKRLTFNDNLPIVIGALQKINNLKELEIRGPGLFDYTSLDKFPRLSKLALTNNSINYIGSMPVLPELSELDLSDNKLQDLSALQRMKGLVRLDISGNAEIRSFAFLNELRKLKELKIGFITKNGYETLKSTFPVLTIDAQILN